MTNDDFERLKLRFGEDVAAWPAPYRQQASNMPTGDRVPPDRDDALDRLVLEAALLDTDEDKLTRHVLARIEADRDWRFGTFLSAVLLKPVTMAASAALLFIALATGGYQMAASQGDAFDAQFLALASGSPLGGDLSSLVAGGDTEDAL